MADSTQPGHHRAHFGLAGIDSFGPILGRRIGWPVRRLFLVFTEWLDGFLARRLHVTSVVGARLDTIADAIFYSSLLAAIVILRPALIGQETIWIAAAVASYLLSWLASWLKFQCLPSYHTWAAKGAWIVVGAGIICLLADGSPWPFRVAMICVALTNLEAICITNILPKCKVDVPSFWHARRHWIPIT